MIWRSEAMEFYDIHLPRENAWYTVREIGSFGKICWVDVSQKENTLQTTCFAQVQQLDYLVNILDKVEEKCLKIGLEIPFANDTQNFFTMFSNYLVQREKDEKKAPHTLINEIQDIILEKDATLSESISNFERIVTEIDAQVHYLNFIYTIKPFADENFAGTLNETQDKDSFGWIKNVHLEFLFGVIDSAEIYRFQKLIFRLTRGNSYLYLTELKIKYKNEFIPDSASSKMRTIYLIAYPSSKDNESIKTRVVKSLEAFSLCTFSFDFSRTSFDSLLEAGKMKFEETVQIIRQAKEKLSQDLAFFTQKSKITNLPRLEEYRLVIEKERSIAIGLSNFRLEGNALRTYFWISKRDSLDFINRMNALKRQSEHFRVDIMPEIYQNKNFKPPTQIKTNDLTYPFQEIVNTYGIPRYLEINPAVFTIITFPFEFGIMFGDIGHGGLILAIGLFLIAFHENLKSSSLKPVLRLRFLLTLMGFFAFFCGLIYNDFLSIPLNLFGSCYQRQHKNFVRKHQTCTYWAGMDPTWYQASNEVAFQNSFKMKLSIIVGVIHMTLGICLKIVNTVFFRNYVDLFFEAIPQLLFFLCSFGYLALAIVLKWLKAWEVPGNAPSLIGIFINMGVTLPHQQLYGDEEGYFQTWLQKILFLVTGLAGIMMFLPKPIILSLKARSYKSHNMNVPNQLEASLLEANIVEKPQKESDESHEDVGEIFVHQFIEVVEFILGSISNTASYLRLWALSLAHSQLAKVFFEMTILNPIKGGSPLIAMIGFPIWMSATVGVLMVMDLIECFLHTLRLHWVEFQNKFFKGDGSLFEEYSIKELAFSGIISGRAKRNKAF